MATRDNSRRRLEHILCTYENLSMENQKEFLLSYIREYKKTLAQSGREADLIHDVRSQYVRLLISSTLQEGNVMNDFKREMNEFFQIKEHELYSHTGGRSGNQYGTNDDKAQLANTIRYAVDAGSASTAGQAGRSAYHSTKVDIKTQSLNSHQSALDRGQGRNLAPGSPKLEDTRKEIMNLKQENEKLRQECQHTRSLKSDNEKLKQENAMLEKEYEKLNQQARKQVELIQKFEANANENYETVRALKEQLQQLEKVKKEFGMQIKENEDLKRRIEKLNKNIETLFYEKNESEKQYEDAKKYIKRKIAEHEDTLKHEKRKNEDELKKILAERDDLRDRFSKLAGSKLTDQNPDIADLSDPNRAMKLSEKFGRLYDDEWTNAFEALTDMGIELKSAIQILLHMLREAWTFCENMSKSQMESLSYVFLHPQQNVSKSTIVPQQGAAGLKDKPRINSKNEKVLRNLRREIGVMPQTVNEIKQAFRMETKSWSKEKNYDTKVTEACSPYLQSCAEICWLMILPDPPLFMQLDVTIGAKLDLNLFSVYSTSGDKINYLVWPALFNCEGGGLLSKGVAEPTRTVKKGK